MSDFIKRSAEQWLLGNVEIDRLRHDMHEAQEALEAKRKELKDLSTKMAKYFRDDGSGKLIFRIFVPGKGSMPDAVVSIDTGDGISPGLETTYVNIDVVSDHL